MRRSTVIASVAILGLVLFAPGVGAGQLKKMQIRGGAGELVSMDPPGCFITHASPCTLTTANVILEGEPFGKGTTAAEIVFLFHLGTPSANGLECFPTAISAVATFANGELFTEHDLTFCELGPDPVPFSPAVSHGAFEITGGTGRYEGAVGGGLSSAGGTSSILVGTMILPSE